MSKFASENSCFFWNIRQCLS